MTTINIFAVGAMSNVYGDKQHVGVDRTRCTAGISGCGIQRWVAGEGRRQLVKQVKKEKKH